MENSTRKKYLVSLAHVLAALLGAGVLLVIGAEAAEKFNLCCIHAWALFHGVLFILLPAYFLLCYLALRPIVQKCSEGSPSTSSVEARRVSRYAVWSLFLSGVGFFLPLVGNGLAIILGHVARRRCKADPNLDGSGLALAGLIIGYIGLAYQTYLISSIGLFSVLQNR